MSNTGSIFTIALALAVFPSLAFSGDEARGPHGGQVVENNTSKFEVKLDPNSTHIEVFTLKPAEKSARPQSVTLYHDTDTSQSIELKAADPRDEFPRFEGQLAPNAGSFVGFELKFGVSLKAVTVLPYIPYIPSKQEKAL